LGSIVTSLQSERSKLSTQLAEQNSSMEAQAARLAEVDNLSAEKNELSDALLAAHAVADEQTTALRLLKLSSHRQVAEVVQSWKNEMQQLADAKDHEM
jgi:hypothetical protein